MTGKLERSSERWAKTAPHAVVAGGNMAQAYPAMKETDNMYGPMLVELDDGVRII